MSRKRQREETSGAGLRDVAREGSCDGMRGWWLLVGFLACGFGVGGNSDKVCRLLLDLAQKACHSSDSICRFS